MSALLSFYFLIFLPFRLPRQVSTQARAVYSLEGIDKEEVVSIPAKITANPRQQLACCSWPVLNLYRYEHHTRSQ